MAPVNEIGSKTGQFVWCGPESGREAASLTVFSLMSEICGTRALDADSIRRSRENLAREPLRHGPALTHRY